MVRLGRVIVLTVSVLYTLAYGLWRTLLLTPLYQRFWQLQLSEVFGSWFYLPLLPLLLLVLLTRERRGAGILLIPLLFFSVEYGRQFLPNWQGLWSADEGAVTIRVMTWNMLYSIDRNHEFQTLVTTLQPDIIALQELSYRFTYTLPEKLAKQYPYQHVYAAGRSSSLAVLSRYPLQNEQIEMDLAACRCQQMRIDLAGRPITLVNAHVWSPTVSVARHRRIPRVTYFDNDSQTLIFDVLMAQLNTISGPLIVLGDLNTTERQPNFRRLQRTLDDAFASAGWGMGYTFPTNVQYRGWRLPPFVQIDHILFNDDWQARAAWTGQLSASDHSYVVADLELQQGVGSKESSH